MSLWSHRELRIIVCPDQVMLLPVRRTLTMRGLQDTIRDPHIVSCHGAISAAPWRAALQALETALLCFANGRTAASVILSNHFLRYTLVPWQAELADEKEDYAFARHCFTKVYGKAVQQWEVRLSHEAPEMPRVASAVNVELLDALRGVFDGAGVTLHSIQPHLMAAFNGFRKRLQHRSVWFALLEPGNLCLALLHHGRWMRVSSQRIGNAWRDELPLILDREACLADHPSVTHEVYVWDTRPGDTTLPETGHWQFHSLTAGVQVGNAAMQDRNFAIAMAG